MIGVIRSETSALTTKANAEPMTNATANVTRLPCMRNFLKSASNELTTGTSDRCFGPSGIPPTYRLRPPHVVMDAGEPMRRSDRRRAMRWGGAVGRDRRVGRRRSAAGQPNREGCMEMDPPPESFGLHPGSPGAVGEAVSV